MIQYTTGDPLNSDAEALVNFSTKRHWRDRSRIEDIEARLHALAAEIRRRGIRSIAIPPPGCGLGGLAWSEVRPGIEPALGRLTDVRILISELTGPGHGPGSVRRPGAGGRRDARRP